jgi:hypothetical protein
MIRDDFGAVLSVFVLEVNLKDATLRAQLTPNGCLLCQLQASEEGREERANQMRVFMYKHVLDFIMPCFAFPRGTNLSASAQGRPAAFASP